MREKKPLRIYHCPKQYKYWRVANIIYDYGPPAVVENEEVKILWDNMKMH